MNLDYFILSNQLMPADALIVKKEPFRLLDHYIIYLGNDNGKHKFIANYTKGTRILTDQELYQFSAEFSPNRIVRFQGNAMQRNTAVKRATSRQDQSSYHLILNNCEHFSSYVQTGKNYSSQTKTFGTGLILTGLAAAATSRKRDAQTIGMVAAALGLITLLLDEE